MKFVGWGAHEPEMKFVGWGAHEPEMRIAAHEPERKIENAIRGARQVISDIGGADFGGAI